ncbi:MAG: zf-HC2 domain-containing protein [Ruminococcus sp.]|nr:zf-HC2 domain-containing protein [Ruminococcus sp.]
MKYNCDMIADLLPLYIDHVCSESSREAIEEHLSECQPCQKLYEDMKKCDTVIDQSIVKERDEVLVKQAKFFRRRSAIAGSIIGAIFAIPILVCLIVNLAAGAGLTWFFIVLAAMFIPTSLIVVPLMAAEDKFFWCATSFTASLIALLGVCSIYSGGTWFFTAAPAVLFGLAVPFMPFIVNSKPVAKRIGNNKALAVVGTYTLTYILMMVCIGIRHGSENFFRIAAAYSLPYLLFMWAMFALIRLPKWNRLLKAASCILVSALLFFFNDTIVLMIFKGATHIPKPSFSFETYEMANDTLCWSVLIIGSIVSAVLALAGLAVSGNKNKKEK